MFLPPTVTSLRDGAVVYCAKAGAAMRVVAIARVVMSIFENPCKISAVGLHISVGGSKSQCSCISSRYGDEVQLLLIKR